MQILHTLGDFLAYRNSVNPTLKIGLVPTMGALHQGHISLVQRSISDNDITIASIFVNPTQFGPEEDFEEYPRQLEEDSKKLDSLGVNAIFAPQTSEIYPDSNFIQFRIQDLGDRLDARSRPGHMQGVLQIVNILFNVIRPDRAYFGMKDYQQFIIIRQMAKELHMPVEVVPCPIIREEDGLAMSSRNVYLNPEERKQALFLYQLLNRIRQELYRFSETVEIRVLVEEMLDYYPLVKLDYFEVLDEERLTPVKSINNRDNLRAFVAAYLGETRLIDNMSLN